MFGATAAAPWVVPARALGLDGVISPSNRITVGGIGMGNRIYDWVFPTFLPLPEVRFLAVCDVRANRRELSKNTVNNHYHNKDCTTYRDFRELLDRKDIDAVLIGTGDRWHAHVSMMAAAAGKDIYSEKPCAITIELCGRLADTIRRYGRVFQGGPQRRSTGNFVWAVNLARSGKLGKLKAVRATTYPMGETHNWLLGQPEPPRDVVDWNLWLGPAPWRPFHNNYINGGWRGFYDLDSGARLLDWGAHTVDLCQWANNADGTEPVEYEPAGNTRYLRARYANGVKLTIGWVGNNCNEDGWHDLGTCSVRFEGEDGWVETGDTGKIAVYPESLRNDRAIFTEQVLFPKQHVRNFLNCVKTREQPVCNADVIRSSHIACHCLYLSWLLNRKLKFDPVKEEFIGDDEANRLRSRPERDPWNA
jgi:predicted dehydrogenase